MRRIAAVMLCLGLSVWAVTWAPSARAESSTWNLDMSHSTIGFSVRHMMVSNTRGSFAKASGTAVGDPANPAAATVEVTVDTASIDTGNADRDKHLRAPDFFDVEKFPTMTFKSNRIESVGGKLRVVGNLTLHGVTRELALDVEELNPPVNDPMGKVRAGARLQGTLDRRDYGLTSAKTMDNGGLLIGNEVRLAIEVEAIRAQ